MKTTRDEVYAAIDGECDYQGEEYKENLSIKEELNLISDYMDEAELYEKVGEEIEALRNVRKIAGIAVRCMENHGAPKR